MNQKVGAGEATTNRILTSKAAVVKTMLNRRFRRSAVLTSKSMSEDFSRIQFRQVAIGTLELRY